MKLSSVLQDSSLDSIIQTEINNFFNYFIIGPYTPGSAVCGPIMKRLTNKKSQFVSYEQFRQTRSTKTLVNLWVILLHFLLYLPVQTICSPNYLLQARFHTMLTKLNALLTQHLMIPKVTFSVIKILKILTIYHWYKTDLLTVLP